MGGCNCLVSVLPNTASRPEQELGLFGKCLQPSDWEKFPSDAGKSDKEDGSTASGGTATSSDGLGLEAVDSDNETFDKPKDHVVLRRCAVWSEPSHKEGYYKEPFWNKLSQWEAKLFHALAGSSVFHQFRKWEIKKFVRAMEIHMRNASEPLLEQGEIRDGLYVVLVGTVMCYKSGSFVSARPAGSIIDEHAVLWRAPGGDALKAKDDDCIVAMLRRTDYVDLCFRIQFQRRELRKQYLRSSTLLQMMDNEQIAKLTDVLRMRTYEAGEPIVKQDDPGDELFIIESGEAQVSIRTADTEQVHNYYKEGAIFGERALQYNQCRAATVTALTRLEVLCLSRDQLERMFGGLGQLQQQQYLSDPRKLIADFYMNGDLTGPLGSLQLAKRRLEPDAPESQYFAVYRPTSHDAIQKMLSGTAVGKGLNIKGKSAKQGVLSGYVPFIQISDNKHKGLIEASPSDNRVAVYYKTQAARKEAEKLIISELSEVDPDGCRSMKELEDYAPVVYGLDMLETVLREAYIMRQDLSPMMGWETGRRSEPAFMDANLHAIRGNTDPKVVLYQNDENDAMNPRGLLVAYAEKYVKPVVSDFDTFLVGSTTLEYEPLPLDQSKIVSWALDRTDRVLSTPDDNNWTSRWLDVLKNEAEQGNDPPVVPKYGFSDPTSYRLIGDVVTATKACGAVRHGPECYNFYFPQELDDQYLIIWQKFPDKPWQYTNEEQLRAFLLDRVREGFVFPINPIWPVRDTGWYSVLQALRESSVAKSALRAFFPPQGRILDKIDEVHKKHPAGFRIVNTPLTSG